MIREEGKPHKWVIEVTQDMTASEACALGRVLGANGYTGRFLDGDIAGLAIDGARWRDLQRGGEG